MADYRIVCTDQKPFTNPTTHAHIVAVGVDTDNDSYADQKHDLQTVVSGIDSGKDRYYTKSQGSLSVAYVETIDCPYHCGERIIRSTPDTRRDNNLDYLRRCNWTQ